MKKWIFAGLILALFCTPARAQVVILEGPLVTDVTPRSFSVLWISSEPADPFLKIYDETQQDITEVVKQTAFPSLDRSETLTAYARDVGMLKVRVEGLEPDTEYYFETVTETSEETVINPGDAPMAVRTERSSEVIRAADDLLPGGNDLARFQVFKPDGIFAARGSLLVAWVEQASYPISAYVGDSSVGDGAEPGLVMLDLNNSYDANTHRSLILTSPEVVTLKAFRGNGGQGDTLLHYRKVPDNTGIITVFEPQRGYLADFNLDGTINLYDATLFTGSWGLAIGDNAYNSDYDLDLDEDVDADDSLIFKAEYGESEPFVD